MRQQQNYWWLFVVGISPHLLRLVRLPLMSAPSPSALSHFPFALSFPLSPERTLPRLCLHDSDVRPKPHKQGSVVHLVFGLSRTTLGVPAPLQPPAKDNRCRTDAGIALRRPEFQPLFFLLSCPKSRNRFSMTPVALLPPRTGGIFVPFSAHFGPITSANPRPRPSSVALPARCGRWFNTPARTASRKVRLFSTRREIAQRNYARPAGSSRATACGSRVPTMCCFRYPGSRAASSCSVPNESTPKKKEGRLPAFILLNSGCNS